ncbi:MAG: type 4 pilin N-terminal cleavage/methylation protein, partial [Herminiimonas sp.]|nr:type 4 pilin N-terminal cleavage/methylation protein [Herminiimonas sp.]
GFSLIELMVTVVIIGILAAVVIPSYRDHIRRGTLPQAFATLSDMRVKLEQFYQSNRRYGTVGPTVGPIVPCANDGTGPKIDFTAASAPTSGRFTYSCRLTGTTAFPDQAYELMAVGSTGPAVGHIFTLDSNNVRSTTMFKGDVVSRQCWLVVGGEC